MIPNTKNTKESLMKHTHDDAEEKGEGEVGLVLDPRPVGPKEHRHEEEQEEAAQAADALRKQKEEGAELGVNVGTKERKKEQLRLRTPYRVSCTKVGEGRWAGRCWNKKHNDNNTVTQKSRRMLQAVAQ